jgi:hypothetical protein
MAAPAIRVSSAAVISKVASLRPVPQKIVVKAAARRSITTGAVDRQWSDAAGHHPEVAGDFVSRSEFQIGATHPETIGDLIVGAVDGPQRDQPVASIRQSEGEALDHGVGANPSAGPSLARKVKAAS